jgi:hypothetical protein
LPALSEDTLPITHTLVDGRIAYEYTVGINGNTLLFVTFSGRFNTLPANGQYVSSVEITPPYGFLETNTNDNSATLTGMIGILTSDRTEYVLTGDPVTLNVTATNSSEIASYTWTQSGDNGATWSSSLPTTIASHTHSGTAYALVRCIDRWNDNECRDTVIFRLYEAPDNVQDPNCVITPTGYEWSMAGTYSVEHNLSPYQTVMVGDIDGDGIVKIIASADPVERNPVNTENRLAMNLAIYKRNNIQAPPKIINTRSGYSWDYRVKYGLLRTRIDGLDSTLIVVAEFDRHLRAYNYNGELIWESIEEYHTSRNNGTPPTLPT